MKNALLFIVLIPIAALAAKPNADKIMEEGKYLYALEKASWVSTDHFLDHFKAEADAVTGYFSYKNGESLITIFYNKFDTLKLLARYRMLWDQPGEFVGLPESRNLIPTKLEEDLIVMREKSAEIIKFNKDDYFTFYKGLSFNLIPVINKKERVVYVLSASHTDDFIYLGNDYILTFDKKNKYRGVERIHKSLIKLSTHTGTDTTQNATIHSHVLSDVIDPTDICTLLLYRNFVDWDMHYVMSKKYVTVFDLRSEKLVFIKTKDWKKIGSDLTGSN